MPPKAPPQASSFTLKSNPSGLLLCLATDCFVSGVLSPEGVPLLEPKVFKCIWDTGATNSVITAAVASQCGLLPTGKTIVHGVGGQHECHTYLVNITLPNSITVRDVKVTEGKLGGGASGDVLIGMDIITLGDFCLTNRGGRTVFTFRVPSQACIDYVEEHQRALLPAATRTTTVPRRKAKKQFGKNKRR